MQDRATEELVWDYEWFPAGAQSFAQPLWGVKSQMKGRFHDTETFSWYRLRSFRPRSEVAPDASGTGSGPRARPPLRASWPAPSHPDNRHPRPLATRLRLAHPLVPGGGTRSVLGTDAARSRAVPHATPASSASFLRGVSIAERTRDAWTGLSRAAHHHAYELAPTAAELRDWHATVSQLTHDLAT